MLKLAGALVLGVCALGAAGWQKSRLVDNFSDLRKGDTVKILYQTSGCFHQSGYELMYRRGQRATIDFVLLLHCQRRKGLSRLFPSDGELRGLDQLLKFYRSDRTNGCATVDTVAITQSRGIKLSRARKFVDGSCSVREAKDVLSLGDLITRALEPTDNIP